MTIGSVVAATFFLLLLVVGGAVFGWANAVAMQRWYWLFVVVLLVLVLLTVSRPALAPFTGIVYSLGQGALVGSISRVYEAFYDGVVFLALAATVATFLSMLLLYALRIVKVTQRVRSVIIVATLGIGLFYLLTWLLSLFNVDVPLVTGVGTGALVFSILVVIVAALNLLLDPGDRARNQRRSPQGVLVVCCLRAHGHHRLALYRASSVDRDRHGETPVGTPVSTALWPCPSAPGWNGRIDP